MTPENLQIGQLLFGSQNSVFAKTVRPPKMLQDSTVQIKNVSVLSVEDT